MRVNSGAAAGSAGFRNPSMHYSDLRQRSGRDNRKAGLSNPMVGGPWFQTRRLAKLSEDQVVVLGVPVSRGTASQSGRLALGRGPLCVRLSGGQAQGRRRGKTGTLHAPATSQGSTAHCRPRERPQGRELAGPTASSVHTARGDITETPGSAGHSGQAASHTAFGWT